MAKTGQDTLDFAGPISLPAHLRHPAHHRFVHQVPLCGLAGALEHNAMVMATARAQADKQEGAECCPRYSNMQG